MEKGQLELLKGFVTLCKKNPAVLHKPELSFYKEWLERYLSLFRHFIFLSIFFDIYIYIFIIQYAVLVVLFLPRQNQQRHLPILTNPVKSHLPKYDF